MIARPRTRPGNTIGSEATVSRTDRPGSFVLTTIQQMTEVTSITMVALPTARNRLFHTVRPRSGYANTNRYGSSVRLPSASRDGAV
jgi:hypothetical protein